MQTRAHFLAKYGNIVDNPKVGADLTEGYWRPGNGAPFLELVERLTGKPLSADAWVAGLVEDLGAKVQQEHKEYVLAVKGGRRVPLEDVDLGMQILVVDGDDLICDSAQGGLGAVCTQFQSWVAEKAAAH